MGLPKLTVGINKWSVCHEGGRRVLSGGGALSVDGAQRRMEQRAPDWGGWGAPCTEILSSRACNVIAS